MKPDLYKALKNYAHESFEETYAGLYTRIRSVYKELHADRETGC